MYVENTTNMHLINNQRKSPNFNGIDRRARTSLRTPKLEYTWPQQETQNLACL